MVKVKRRSAGETKYSTGSRLAQILVFAYLVLLPHVFSFTGIEKFRVPKSLFSLLAILSIAAVLVFLGRLNLRVRFWSYESLVLAGLVYATLHSAVSAEPRASFSALLYLWCFGLLFFCLKSLLTERFQKLLWLGIGSSLSLSAILAVMQYHGKVSGMVTSTGETISGRVTPAGFIGDVNSGGFLFGLAVLIMLYYVVTEDRPYFRVLGAVILSLNLVGLGYTRTLTALAALLVCLSIWLIFHHWWSFRWGQGFSRALVIFWMLFVLGVGGGGYLAFQAGVSDRIGTVVGQMERGDWTFATAGRQPVFWLTWQMIQEHPLLGTGLNTFGREFFSFRIETEAGQSVELLSQPGAFQEAHNEYLQTWLELGIIGFILLLAVLFIPLVQGLRRILRERDGDRCYWYALHLLAVLYVGVVSLAFFPLHLAVTAAYFILILAALRRYETLPEDELNRVESREWGPLTGVVAYALSLALLLWSGYSAFNKWSANNQVGMAAVILERAAGPGLNARQQRLLADEALRRLERAEEKTGSLEQLENLKGVANLFLGRYESSVTNFQKAAEEAPSPEVFTNLASAYLAQENQDRAQEYVEVALRYDPLFGKARQAQRHLETLSEP